MGNKNLFLNRVYDKYFLKDFTIGDNNLNPKRELDPYNVEQNDKNLEALRNYLEGQVLKAKKNMLEKGLKPLDILDLADDKFAFNNGSASGNNNILESDYFKGLLGRINAKKNSSLFVDDDPFSGLPGTPPPHLLPDDLIIEFGLPLTGGIGESGGGSDNKPNPFKNITYAPFSLACEYMQENEGDTNSDKGDNPNNKNNEGFGGESLLELLNDDSLNDTNVISAQVKNLLSALENADTDFNKKEEDCILRDLFLIKIITIIIKILNIFNMIVAYVFAIVTPILEIATLACGLWVCPAGIGEIIQKMAQQIISILSKQISILIAKMMELINSNCLTQQALRDLDGLYAVRQGLAALNNSMGSTFSLVGNSYKSVLALMEQLDMVGKKAALTVQEKDKIFMTMKDQFSTMGVDLWEQTKSEGIQQWEKVKNIGINQYQQQVNKVMGIVNESKGVKNAFTKGVKDLTEATDNYKKKIEKRNKKWEKLKALYDAEARKPENDTSLKGTDISLSDNVTSTINV